VHPPAVHARTAGAAVGMRIRARTMLAALALLAAACAGGETARDALREEAGAEGSASAPSTAPSPAPPAPAPREGELAEVMIVEGWHPYAVFDGGFNPWLDGAAMEVMGWLDQLLPARPAPAGAVAIDVDVTVEREPAPCFAFHRPVTAVRVDVPGGAAATIGAQLLAAAQRESARIDSYRWTADEGPEDHAWCEERFGGELAGFHIVEVHAEACALPGGPDVVCATVGVFGYHLGAREFWFGDTFVFDAATGERIDRDALLGPYDPALLDELFVRIRVEVPIDVPHLAEQGVVGTDLDLLPTSDDADVVPTAEGMRWRWSPYRHITGSIDVVVPWDVLADVRGMP
jgi:hypothetical protein